MAERNDSETAKADQLLTRVGGTQSGATDAVDSRLVVLQEAIAQNSAGAEQLAGRFDTHLEALFNANTRALRRVGRCGKERLGCGGHCEEHRWNDSRRDDTQSSASRSVLALGGGSSSDNTPAPLASYVAPAAVRVRAGWCRGRLRLLLWIATTWATSDLCRRPEYFPNHRKCAGDGQPLLCRSQRRFARAVRRAMLESSSLNDVVSEL